MQRKKTRIRNSRLTAEEKNLLARIRGITNEFNLNNVTRTKAYLDIYRLHPELHWAFLGHMVSRNGGWNMTDLKGELLSRLLSSKEKRSFFSFLERGNWLIFQDVYPQFLLYRESVVRNKAYFHLLPYLKVSVFMEPVWDYFWRERDKTILTIALIINEQSYLEKRVVQNPLYQKKVLNTLEFKLQDLLSFNQILFPYWKNGVLKLAGQSLHQFASLHERILLGKRLYAILFQNKEVLKGAEAWADDHPHTGSRKDFWPEIFNNVHEGLPGKAYQLRLKSCKLKPGGRRIFSPSLEFAWKNVEHSAAEEGDWYEGPMVFDYFSDMEEIIDEEIQDEYCKTLERLEIAAFAKKAISFLD